jgi:hypothetical protein
LSGKSRKGAAGGQLDRRGESRPGRSPGHRRRPAGRGREVAVELEPVIPGERSRFDARTGDDESSAAEGPVAFAAGKAAMTRRSRWAPTPEPPTVNFPRTLRSARSAPSRITWARLGVAPQRGHPGSTGSRSLPAATQVNVEPSRPIDQPTARNSSLAQGDRPLGTHPLLRCPTAMTPSAAAPFQQLGSATREGRRAPSGPDGRMHRETDLVGEQTGRLAGVS